MPMAGPCLGRSLRPHLHLDTCALSGGSPACLGCSAWHFMSLTTIRGKPEGGKYTSFPIEPTWTGGEALRPQARSENSFWGGLASPVGGMGLDSRFMFNLAPRGISAWGGRVSGVNAIRPPQQAGTSHGSLPTPVPRIGLGWGGGLAGVWCWLVLALSRPGVARPPCRPEARFTAGPRRAERGHPRGHRHGHLPERHGQEPATGIGPPSTRC